MIKKMFDLSGKKAVITGGSRGIGYAIASGLAHAGATPHIVCRSKADGQKALDQIKLETSIRGAVYPGDLSSRIETDKLVTKISHELGTVDILVHSAGGNVAEPVDRILDESWDSTLELNLNSAMAILRGLAPKMVEQRWGRFIFISSIMGIASREERATYSASKAGLVGFMKSAALELGPSGVTVNCIAPGPIETELTANLKTSEAGKEYESRMALRRWGQPEEIVGPALLLASNAGSFITGTTLVVDGGALARAI